MDITTVVGLLLGVLLLGYSMAMGAGGIMLFVDVPSILIVGGGTAAVMLINYPSGDIKLLVAVSMRTLFFKLGNATDEIQRVIEYATLARKEGLLALESKLREVDDKFFAKGIQLVIDGFPSETVRDIMELEASWQLQRHSAGKKMLDQIAAYGPAFGMIGTLVGLVQMLANLSDPSQIGGGMAVALLTTLYGALLANLFCMPMAAKLEVRAKEEALLRDLMIEGIVAIQSGDGPQLIKEKLKTFVPPRVREQIGA